MLVSMEISVPEAARLMGVSVGRARRHAAEGRVRAPRGRALAGRRLVAVQCAEAKPSDEPEDTKRRRQASGRRGRLAPQLGMCATA